MKIAVLRYRSLGDVIHAVAACCELFQTDNIISEFVFFTDEKLVAFVERLFSLGTDYKENIKVQNRDRLSSLPKDFKFFDFQSNLRSIDTVFRSGKISRKVKRFKRFKQDLLMFRSNEPGLDSLENFREIFNSCGLSLKKLENFTKYNGQIQGYILWIQAAAWPVKMPRPELLLKFLELNPDLKVLGGKNIAVENIPLEKLCPQKDLLEIVDSIRAAKFVISGDTGFFHLAEFLGVPGILLSGPTGPQTGVFSHHDLSELYSLGLACSPCCFNGRRGCFYGPDIHAPCMNFSSEQLSSKFQAFESRLL